jgi:RNA polymerase sigma factor (TIGR02999 family)
MDESENSGDVAALLNQWRAGDGVACQRLVALVYSDLRQVARAHLRREHAGHSLQPTALVHEVYLRLVNLHRLRVENRTHFIAFAARLMRQILVDYARRKQAGKRAGAAPVVSLDSVSPDEEPAACDNNPDILALDRALDELASLDMQQCQVVEMKFFGGLTIAEIADALDVSTATVEREWFSARAWLYERLSGEAV